MNEVKDILQRKAARFPRAEEPWDGVSRRLARRHRRRQATAGFVAIAVFSAGAFGALRLFQSNPVAVERAGSFHALWPETDQASLAGAQARADEGGATWRTSGMETAVRFARTVLGWPNANVGGQANTSPGPGERWDLAVDTCGDDRTCSESPGVMIGVQQLGRRGDGGVWSVTLVTDIGGELSTGLQPGQEIVVPARTSVTATPNVAPRVQVTYGWRSEDCDIELSARADYNESVVSSLLQPFQWPCDDGVPRDIFYDRTPRRRLTEKTAGWIAFYRPGPSGFSEISLRGVDAPRPYDPIRDITIIPVTFVPREDNAPAPAPDRSAGFAVWPEDTFPEAREIQDSVDFDMETPYAWRLDPQEVARRSIEKLMGLHVSRVRQEQSRPRVYRVTTEGGHDEVVTVDQLVGRGFGLVWNVVEIHGTIQVLSASIGAGPDRVAGRGADPGSSIRVHLQYGAGQGWFGEARADANGAFSVVMDPGVPSPHQTGSLIVGVLGPGGTLLDLTAIALPANDLRLPV
jgi:hypothetical protein